MDQKEGTNRSSLLKGADGNGDEESVFEDDAAGSVGDAESILDGTSVGDASGAERKGGGGQEHDIGRQESRMVAVARLLVVGLLLVVTAGVGWGVYYYVSTDQQKTFEKNYDDWSDKVLATMGSTLDQSLGSCDNLMVSIVSFQEYSNSTWPFVTFPDFNLVGEKILSLSRASVIIVAPRVTNEQRTEWEQYALDNDGWVNTSLILQRSDPSFKGINVETFTNCPEIYDNTGASVPESPVYYPSWSVAPNVPVPCSYNWDYNVYYPHELRDMEQKRKVILGRTTNLVIDEASAQQAVYETAWLEGSVGPDGYANEPMFPLNYPIVTKATSSMVISQGSQADHQVVGIVSMTILWRNLIRNTLSAGANGVVAVIGSDCNQTLTYQINGPDVVYLGPGDKHNPEYNKYEKGSYLHELVATSSSEALEIYTGMLLSEDYCPYWVKLYPSNLMLENSTNNDPLVFTLCAISIFIFTSAIFLVFDCISERRQKKVMEVAVQSTAVVSSLFPQVFRERLFSAKKDERTKPKPNERIETARLRLQHFLRNDEDDIVDADRQAGHKPGHDAPIAELFSETTVMFADIAGFTAWSSVREPCQVFTLLETLYGAFDRIASRRGVFKVETIGDSYVAVAGLPDPCEDHAVVMAKFARDIREKMRELTERLGRTLGPDTDGLELRIGLNSGPVTAGVLRGERSRFQLFGDTVNTAARMESTGKVSKIHASESTTLQLKKHGKAHWITKRDGQVEAKGKGSVQTYWIEPTTRRASSVGSSEHVEEGKEMVVMDDKTRRLVEWNVEIIAKLLKQVVARREAVKDLAAKSSRQSSKIGQSAGSQPEVGMIQISGNPLDEVKEVIMLPDFDPSLILNPRDINAIELSTAVMTQLREYISLIASMYRDNPFHNFEHASHVAMSVVKLLSRIVAPTDRVIQTAEETHEDFVQTLHDHTYGITSDPLTQFTCVFSALIHDVDHPGIPNAQLIKEESPLNAAYKGKSLAEQNSVDISWKLFFDDSFDDLRQVVCPTKAEMSRFRQLVVNAVMATDIMDKDLKTLRNQRWDKAFQEGSRLGETMTVNINRKATIVIEHLIQASDVAHTMQHWHIFRKWNERLFTEMYNAYRSGRAETNPAEFWYKGEIGFFDFYIIPLAKKLSDCGVFGVSSDEYLNYALKNREEWENRGMDVVAEMLSKFEVPKELLGANDDDKLAADDDNGNVVPAKFVEKSNGPGSKLESALPQTVVAVPLSIRVPQQQPEQAQPLVPVKVDL